ncbi:MAG TPA: extracellular solute-binding protein [Pirellulales bacterium]|nr:extracellular solute-binding protein [Pirellulales bacterium]
MPTLLFLGCTAEKQHGGEAAAEKELPWKGVTLRLAVAGDARLAEAIGRLRSEWQATTGAELEVAEMTESALIGDKPHAADAIIYPAYDLGVLVERGWLLALPEKSLNSDELAWAEIFEADKTFDASWGAVSYGFPLGSPTFVCCYRKDLLAKLDRQPPQSWAEYQELSEVLADREKLGDAAPATDAPWSGTMEPLAEGWAGLTLLARAAAYAKHRNHFSTLFDMQSMDPLIAGAPFVRALEELTAARSHMPEEAIDASPQRVHETLLAGQCGMALTWTSGAFNEEPVAEAPTFEESATAKSLEIGFVELPGSPQAFNPKTGEWDERREGESPRVPLVGLAGRLGSVMAESAHADAAFQLLAWLSGPQWSKRVATASTGTTLYRKSHVEASGDWADPRLGDAAALDYAEMVERSLSSAELFGAPRIEGRARYLAALDLSVREAVSGKATSEDALQTAADEWRKITADLGLERQRSAYRRSLGLK